MRIRLTAAPRLSATVEDVTPVGISPNRDGFRALARSYSVVPVWRVVLADLTTPVAAYTRIVGSDNGFLLESVEHGGRWSRWAFMGRNPLITLLARSRSVEVIGDIGFDIPRNDGILAALDAVLYHCNAPALKGLPPLHGGLVGYLGYDVAREVEHLPCPPPDDTGHPDAVMSVFGDLAVYDHWLQQATLISNVMVPPVAEGISDGELDLLYDDAALRVEAMAADVVKPLNEALLAPLGPVVGVSATGIDQPDGGGAGGTSAVHTGGHPPGGELTDVISTMGLDLYSQAVDTAKEYILAGDVFQVVLSQRFSFDLDAEAFDVYRVLRQINPSPYMYYLRHGDMEIVGGSPEPMVKLLDGRVISRPIAGTRRRGNSDEEDRRLGAELLEHPKEVAEHVMLVDLARNDLGRVVEFGSLELDELMTLERYSHVMHLTSQVSGRLSSKATPIDVLRATLPAGTVSGAPKVRAMEIIDELEPVKRGPYAGVVGYIDFSGNLDTALTIRTMLVCGGRASVQSGAGIVADSDAASEHAECENKARALLAAVPAARRMTAARRAAEGVSGSSASRVQ